MLDFPSSPTVGQYYTSSVRSWRYNGTTWELLPDPWLDADSFSGQPLSYFATSALLTGHTGDSTIHFTQAQISIPTSQISNFSSQVGSIISNTFLYDLFDVSDVEPSDTQVLIYNENDTLWEPQSQSVLSISTGQIPSFAEAVQDTLAATIVAGSGISTSYNDGTNTFTINNQYSGDLRADKNLDTLTDYNKARKYLKVRYNLDDLSPFDANGVWTSAQGGAGSTYQYDPQFASFMRTKDCVGVVVASNGSATASTDAAIRVHNNAALWLASGLTYYFRAAVSHSASAFYRFGLSNTNHGATSDVVNGAYFEYDSTTDTVWKMCTASGSTRTKTNSSATIADSVSAFKWFGIEWVETGINFYDITASGSTPIGTITTNLPPITNRVMRAFFQCQGNGGTFRGVYMDKIGYPLYYDDLPLGPD
jgi:hypothetical protein